MTFGLRNGANWLEALRAARGASQPAALITVSRADGSAPREAGARMAVGPDWQADTIGGGTLEFRAIEVARELIAGSTGQRRTTLRMPLGASLGQCCGGVVFLAIERIDLDDDAWLAEAVRAAVYGEIRVRHVPLSDTSANVTLTRAEGEAGETRLVKEGDAEWLVDVLLPSTMQVVLFGAGHVGRALADLLGTLPCRVSWIDARDDMFPDKVADNVVTEVGDDGDVARQPAGAYWLILTHNHALDFDIVEKVLKRGDAAYVGLIGSKSKRANFTRRLEARGVSRERVAAEMTCPIGIEGIDGKEPPVIAVSVVAQLLQLHEARLRALRD
ncbi:xanthine dehydrogenase accessory protein XdhC [Crenobacter cavernae]|uniref:Xanthine dehydrogenase accessory protein XdhC n=1 Tax=Crenobacter cavernae TaxID=2290923 RepID=A0A345Y2A4_9NEIS|nr:xanthine dehydrogenase accessory protein XdhC [Crenobacter cavernae]AXK38056.1 xanthine dehydrogenase accessory protein XdhC [Crenobacter cavernae]